MAKVEWHGDSSGRTAGAPAGADGARAAPSWRSERRYATWRVSSPGCRLRASTPSGRLAVTRVLGPGWSSTTPQGVDPPLRNGSARPARPPVMLLGEHPSRARRRCRSPFLSLGGQTALSCSPKPIGRAPTAVASVGMRAIAPPTTQPIGLERSRGLGDRLRERLQPPVGRGVPAATQEVNRVRPRHESRQPTSRGESGTRGHRGDRRGGHRSAGRWPGLLCTWWFLLVVLDRKERKRFSPDTGIATDLPRAVYPRRVHGKRGASTRARGPRPHHPYEAAAAAPNAAA